MFLYLQNRQVSNSTVVQFHLALLYLTNKDLESSASILFSSWRPKILFADLDWPLRLCNQTYQTYFFPCFWALYDTQFLFKTNCV